MTPDQETAPELFCDITVECISCKLKRKVLHLARQGTPPIGTIILGIPFFGANCLRCGVEKFKILTGPPPEPAPPPPVGWVKIPG